MISLRLQGGADRSMRVFLNELALADAWTSTSSAHRTLTDILQTRQRQPMFRDALYCGQAIGGVLTPAGLSLARAAKELPRDTRLQLFEWIAKRGPFIENDRQPIDQDLFFFEDDEVTDLGLGEAARRIRVNFRAAAFSPIKDKHSRFSGSPLTVVQGFQDEPIAQVSIANYTESTAVVEVLYALDPDPTNWQDLLETCRHRFDLLHIGTHCDETLGHFPYMPAAGRRIIELLKVLHHIRAEMDHAGQLSTTGLELRNKFFTGQRAWFSDESEGRKRKPGKFTFPDPEGGNDIVCFWHGKVSTAAIRVHFDWPIQPGTRRIRIAYIGPHI